MGNPYIDEAGKANYAVRAVRSFLFDRNIVKPGDYLALDETEYLYRIKGGDVVDSDYQERQETAKVEIVARFDSETVQAEAEAKRKAAKRAARKAKKVEAPRPEPEPEPEPDPVIEQVVEEQPAPTALSDEELRAQFAELSQGFDV